MGSTSQILHYPLAITFFVFLLSSLDKAILFDQHEIQQPRQLLYALAVIVMAFCLNVWLIRRLLEIRNNP